MANLLQAMGNAQPVSQFIDTALKYQTVQSNMETQRMKQQLLQQQVLQSEKDNKQYDPNAVLSLYDEHVRPHIMEAWKQSGVLDPSTGQIRGADVRNTPNIITENQKVSEALMTAEYERLAKKNATLAKKTDAASQEEALSNVAQMTAIEKARRLGKDNKDKFKAVNTGEGVLPFNESTGEAGEAIGTSPEKGGGAGGIDPSVVRTFEAAHPELVEKRGTKEYGDALLKFIQSGERPYSQFVGTTSDGKQGITFDARKGTFDVQPLPGGGNIQPKISPTIPTGETTVFQQIGTLKEALGQVTSMYEDSFVGPIAGPAGKIQDNWGVMPNAKRAEFRALTANLYNTIIYLRSGKQINEEEAKRLMDELPTMNISPTGFQAKLKKFTWELNSIERGRLRQLKGAGYRNVGEAQGTPSGPSVMEKRTLPNGQVWESLSDGTFRQVK